MREFDLIVVGGGRSGMAAARFGAGQGLAVCLVERARFGGALHNGLYALRLLLKTSDLLGKSREAIAAGAPRAPDFWRELQDEARRASGELAARHERELQEKSVVLARGEGTLLPQAQVRIQSENGEEIIRGGKIILATGSLSCAPPSIPFDGKTILSPDDVAPALPLLQGQNIAVVGGGAYGCEIAALLNCCAGRVFLVAGKPCLDVGSDPGITADLMEEMRRQKIKLILGKDVLSYYKNEENVDVCLDGGVRFPVRAMIFARAEKPVVSAADPELRLGADGAVWVNERMESSVSGVFAIGGAAGGKKSLYFAETEAKVAVYNAVGKPRILEREKEPLVVFTVPEVAAVGCAAAGSHHKGAQVLEGSCRLTETDLGALTTDGAPGVVKLTADRATRKITGGQVLARNASEMIALIELAVKKGLTAAEIAGLAYGPFSLGIQGAARALLRAQKPD